MLSFDEALARVLALGSPSLDSERMALGEASGRVLADDVLTPFDLPSFDHSAMDGYAVAARDLDAPGKTLPVIGESKAGAQPPPLARGSAMRIFTGAPMPEGADAVVMQEHVERRGDRATFAERATPWQFVRRRGADARSGSLAIARGTRLRPAHLAHAATLDLGALPVARRPVVVFVATGDELRPPGSDARPGTIPDANTAALSAMAERAGAVVRAMPIVGDDRDATEHTFRQALAEADVLVTTGGVSVGDHDVVRPALEAAGVTLDFWRVAVKPGKPLAVGTYRRPTGSDASLAGRPPEASSNPRTRDAVIFGVPGNPASAIVTFGLFGVPLLRALQGDRAPFPPRFRATLTDAFEHARDRLEFVRARVGVGPNGLRATPLPNQASGAVTSMADADALLLVPADVERFEANADVDVLWLADVAL